MLGAANARSLQQKLQAAVKSGGTPGYPVFPNLSSLKESCTGEMMALDDVHPLMSLQNSFQRAVPCAAVFQKKERIRRDVEFW